MSVECCGRYRYASAVNRFAVATTVGVQARVSGLDDVLEDTPGYDHGEATSLGAASRPRTIHLNPSGNATVFLLNGTPAAPSRPTSAGTSRRR
jgi:hypothetical protein